MRKQATGKKHAKKVDYSSYKPSAYLKRVIAESEKEYAEGKYKVCHSVEELMKDLRS